MPLVKIMFFPGLLLIAQSLYAIAAAPGFQLILMLDGYPMTINHVDVADLPRRWRMAIMTQRRLAGIVWL